MDIKYIEFKWEPNIKLRETPLIYRFTDTSSFLSFKDVFEKSVKVDSGSVILEGMVEGGYVFTIVYYNGEKDIYHVFSNGSFIINRELNVIYRNDSIYRYIQQIMYSCFIINNIRLE